VFGQGDNKASFDQGGAMTTIRKQTQRSGLHGAQQERDEQRRLDQRRESMWAAEGHAGSIPRGNQRAEDESLGHRLHEYERLLGH
jgi:hypothetical protein